MNMMWTWCKADLPDDDRDVVVTDGFDVFMGRYVVGERSPGWMTHEEEHWEKDNTVIAWCDIPRHPTYMDYLDFRDKEA